MRESDLSSKHFHGQNCVAGYIAEKGKIRQIFGLVPRSLTSELLAHFLYGWASLSFFVWKRAKTLKGGTKPASISHINTHQPCTISAGIAIRKPSSSATSHPTGSSTIHILRCLPPLSGLWSLVSGLAIALLHMRTFHFSGSLRRLAERCVRDGKMEKALFWRDQLESSEERGKRGKSDARSSWWGEKYFPFSKMLLIIFIFTTCARRKLSGFTSDEYIEIFTRLQPTDAKELSKLSDMS